MLGEEGPPSIFLKLQLMELFRCDWPTLHERISDHDWTQGKLYLETVDAYEKERARRKTSSDAAEKRAQENATRYDAYGNEMR